MTELGKWMTLRIYFPDDQDYVHAKDDRMKLRLECYNSVDGSCRVVVLLGWMRLVCTNGLVIRETKTELSDIHDAHLDLQRIPEIVREGMKAVRKDEARMRRWARPQTGVNPGDLVPWTARPCSRSSNGRPGHGIGTPGYPRPKCAGACSSGSRDTCSSSASYPEARGKRPWPRVWLTFPENCAVQGTGTPVRLQVTSETDHFRP